MTNATSGPTVLDREFLDIRARLLEVAAALDRLNRAGAPERDPRLANIARAIDVLASSQGDRAEQVQMIFSLPYDEAWRTTLSVRCR